MSRTARLVLIGALMLGVVGGGTHAYLSDSATNAENVFRVGTVKVSLEPSASAFDVPALAPGSEATATLTVKNAGTLPYLFTVKARKTAGYTAVWDALSCSVLAEEDGSVLYSGALAGLGSAPRLVPAGSTCRLRVAVGLPATAGDTVAGDYCKVSFDVAAEQVR